MALTTRHPIFIFWGPEHVCLHNDRYQPSLGPEKHPSMLGARGREAWAEIWPIIGLQIELVMRGEGATWHENQLVPIVRHGGLQEVYWTYSYGPIDDETAPNGVGGVLALCTETTAQVLAERPAAAERERLTTLFQQAPGFICTLRGPDHVFEYVNDAHRRLFNSDGWIGKPVREAFPDIAGQGFFELLDQAYATGERVALHGAPARFRLTPDAPEQELFLDFVYAPMIDEAGAVTRIFCGATMSPAGCAPRRPCARTRRATACCSTRSSPASASSSSSSTRPTAASTTASWRQTPPSAGRRPSPGRSSAAACERPHPTSRSTGTTPTAGSRGSASPSNAASRSCSTTSRRGATPRSGCAN